jgi:1-acyl-sn-glycerol-3-phosphate acyltransferase
MQFLYIAVFRLMGWKLKGTVSPSVKKAIFAVAPHWKNSDFFVGLGTRALLKRHIAFLGKAELFKPPFGFIFRALGGMPVDRTRKGNLVESQVNTVKSMPDALIALAPEGTRKDVSRLKSGFYYIALGAGIPIIPVGFDSGVKEVKIGEPFFPSGDFEQDMLRYFVPFFEGLAGPQKTWVSRYKAGIFDH